MVKKKTSKTPKPLSRKARMIVVPILVVVGVGAMILAVLSVIVLPRIDQGSQRGVGADGFRAYTEEDGDLGIGNVVTKAAVVTALGSKATAVSDPTVSKVFNLNGSRSQTVTYEFTRADGKTAHLYVDLMFFKNAATRDSASIYASTQKTNTIGGHPAYYMHAQTLADEREYRLMVVNDLKVYKFVVAQPSGSITINEVAALASLKKLAATAKL